MRRCQSAFSDFSLYVSEHSTDYIISQCVTNYNATAEDVNTN